MTLSANETGVLFRKAATGAGVPAGLAEEAARAALALCAAGGDGAGALLAALERHDAAPKATLRDGVLYLKGGSVILAGPAALDHLAAGGAAAEVSRVSGAGLLAGYAAAAGAISGIAATAENVTDGRTMLVRRDAGPAAKTLPRHDLPAAAHVALTELARGTLVPATAASRARGAGAGNIDND